MAYINSKVSWRALISKIITWHYLGSNTLVIRSSPQMETLVMTIGRGKFGGIEKRYLFYEYSRIKDKRGSLQSNFYVKISSESSREK